MHRCAVLQQLTLHHDMATAAAHLGKAMAETGSPTPRALTGRDTPNGPLRHIGALPLPTLGHTDLEADTPYPAPNTRVKMSSTCLVW